MLGFLTEELMRALARERAEEFRATHPHTERKPEAEPKHRPEPAGNGGLERSHASRRRSALAGC
jgi:hypothetical protein